MTEYSEMSKNQKFIAQARTWPFWAYVGYCALLVVGVAGIAEMVSAPPRISVLAGMGIMMVIEMPRERLQSRSRAKARAANAGDSDR